MGGGAAPVLPARPAASGRRPTAACHNAPMSGNGTGRRGRAVVFDYGNVLYAWESHGALAGRRPARVWEEFVTRGGFPRWNEMADAGVPFGDILAALGRAHPDRPDWAELLADYWRHFPDTLTGPIPGVGAVVDDLLDAGVRLYALTNFNHELFAAFGRPRVPQLERFSGIVVSGQEHLTKPDPAIFRVLLERYGLDAAGVLLVDDSPANTDAAAALGLATHLFRGAGCLRADLTDRGLLDALVD
mgnify:CR=1 FL=1